MSITLNETIDSKTRALKIIELLKKELVNVAKEIKNKITIRSISTDDMLFKVFIPYNDNKFMNNDVNEYKKIYEYWFYDNKWYILTGQYNGDYEPNYCSISKFNFVRLQGNRGTGSVMIPENTYAMYSNQPAPCYQDNNTDNLELRVKSSHSGYTFKKDGMPMNNSYYWHTKSSTVAIAGFWPVFEI